MRQTAKRRLPSLLITLILAALLNLLIFAAMRPWKLQESYRLAFWFSYGALMLAFVLRSLSLAVGGAMPRIAECIRVCRSHSPHWSTGV